MAGRVYLCIALALGLVSAHVSAFFLRPAPLLMHAPLLLPPPVLPFVGFNPFLGKRPPVPRAKPASRPFTLADAGLNFGGVLLGSVDDLNTVGFVNGAFGLNGLAASTGDVQSINLVGPGAVDIVGPGGMDPTNLALGSRVDLSDSTVHISGIGAGGLPAAAAGPLPLSGRLDISDSTVIMGPGASPLPGAGGLPAAAAGPLPLSGRLDISDSTVIMGPGASPLPGAAVNGITNYGTGLGAPVVQSAAPALGVMDFSGQMVPAI